MEIGFFNRLKSSSGQATVDLDEAERSVGA